ncbi:MAG: hypothetical protein ACPHJV_02430 [Miltoncostaeaceae bacterium]
MSIEVQVGPMSTGEFRRLFRYAEAESSGDRAQGKAEDPLRTVAEVIVRHGGAAVGEEVFRVTLPGDADEEVFALRASLIREGIAHRIEQQLDDGLTEEVSWHTHGDHDHERAVVRTARGDVALVAAAWAEMAVTCPDMDIRDRLNDYFFVDTTGHHMTEIPLDVDDDIPDADREVGGVPIMLADEWALVARYHGDLELRDRLNDLYAGRRELGVPAGPDDLG